MRSFLVMTNAVKAQIIVVINAILGLLQVFGVNLTDDQQGAIIIAANAILALWVGLTYTNSHKRIDS